MADIATLGIRVDASGAVQEVRSLGAEMATTGAQAEVMRGKILGAVEGLIQLAAVVEGIHKITEETENAQYAMAQLEAVVKSTGGAAGYTATQLADMAGELEDVTNFSNTAIMNMQSVILTFDKIGHDAIPRVSDAVLNLSTRLGRDLTSTALIVGKALDSPYQGLTMLSRAGIKFTEDEKKVLQALVDSGQAAEAQSIILDKLEMKFGGAAAAAHDTLGGALKGLENEFGHMLQMSKDSTSGVVAVVHDLTGALEFLSDNQKIVIVGIELLAAAYIGRGLAALSAFNEATRQRIAMTIIEKATVAEATAVEMANSTFVLSAAQNKLRANIALGVSDEELAIAEQSVVNAQFRVAMTSQAAAAAETELAAASTIAARSMATAGAMGATAFKAIGGWIGLAVIAATALNALIDHYLDKQNAALDAADAASKKAEEPALKQARTHLISPDELKDAVEKAAKYHRDLAIEMAGVQREQEGLRDGGLKGLETAKAQNAALEAGMKDWDREKEQLKGTKAYLLDYNDALQQGVPIAVQIHDRVVALAAAHVTLEESTKRATKAKEAQNEIDRATLALQRSTGDTVNKQNTDVTQMLTENAARDRGTASLDQWRIANAGAMAVSELEQKQRDIVREAQDKGVQVTDKERAAFAAEIPIVRQSAETHMAASIAVDRHRAAQEGTQAMLDRAAAMKMENDVMAQGIDKREKYRIEEEYNLAITKAMTAGTFADIAARILAAQAIRTQELATLNLTDAEKQHTKDMEELKTATKELDKSVISLADSFEKTLLHAIENFTQHGITSFKAFLTELQGLSFSMIGHLDSTIAATQKVQDAQIYTATNDEYKKTADQIAHLQKVRENLGYVAAGVSGAIGGFNIGEQTGSTTSGMIGGAASGAATGFEVGGPWGAVIGGLAGAVGGLFGAAAAHKQAAIALQKAGEQVAVTLAGMNAQVGQGTNLNANIAAEKLNATNVYNEIDKDFAGKKNEAERNQMEHQVITDENLRIQQLQEEDALLKKTTVESLQARLLRAQGDTVAADALDLQVQQQKELQAATEANLDPTTIALLKQVQAEEARRAAINASTMSIEGAVAGYKLALQLFNFSPSLGPGSSTTGFPTTPTTPSAPTPTNQTPTPTTPPPFVLTANVQVNQKTIAVAVFDQFQQSASDQKGSPANWTLLQRL